MPLYFECRINKKRTPSCCFWRFCPLGTLSLLSTDDDNTFQELLTLCTNSLSYNTGVIGIKDSKGGGERVVFPTVNRDQIETVKIIVNTFSSEPDKIGISIDGHCPEVVREPVAGVLCLFNGGNQLHAVSSIRSGLRMIAAFLYCEENPDIVVKGNKDVLEASCKAFYN